ncbi:MAG: hypothetical protein WCL44_00800 [bacterium]
MRRLRKRAATTRLFWCWVKDVCAGWPERPISSSGPGVAFAGRVTDDELAAEYAGADFVLVPEGDWAALERAVDSLSSDPIARAKLLADWDPSVWPESLPCFVEAAGISGELKSTHR